MSEADRERKIGVAHRIAQVAQVVHESGNPEGVDAGHWVAQFLDAPSPALGGRAPRDFMGTSEGRTVASTLVALMQSGAYP